MTAHLPNPWPQSLEAKLLESRLRAARQSILLLDYDGTLAPFAGKPAEAFPFPGIMKRLATLSCRPSVRLALITGRPAYQLKELLEHCPDSPDIPRNWTPEIWGNHGWERLGADGSFRSWEISAADEETLKRAQRELEELGYGDAIEKKSVSLAVHWRALPSDVRRRLASAIDSLRARYSQSALQFIDFNGGIELRSQTRSKADAIDHILSEAGQEAPIAYPIAYLGDDSTDEDAFRALGSRGLSILVSPEARESYAAFWIRPPEELLQFLDVWVNATHREPEHEH